MCVVLECFSSMTLLACSLYSIVNVMKASGCDVPDWTLDIKKPYSPRLQGMSHVVVSSISANGDDKELVTNLLFCCLLAG